MNGFVWLASYPKSGNTWLRAFLTNYQRDQSQPVDINELDSSSSSRFIFDEIAGIKACDLTLEEIELLRPAVYRQLMLEVPGTAFLKVHDAYTLNAAGEPIFPASESMAALYVVRNPLDVAVSSTSHYNLSLDDVITLMGDSHFCLALSSRNLSSQLLQRLLSWSEHVSSWLDQKAIPVQLIRYEQMHREPIETFSAAVRAAGLPVDLGRLQRALQHSSFDVLRSQEQQRGFRESPSRARSFFRAGKIGSWRDTLSAAQVECIVQAHGTMMRRLGYLTPSGEIAS